MRHGVKCCLCKKQLTEEDLLANYFESKLYLSKNESFLDIIVYPFCEECLWKLCLWGELEVEYKEEYCEEPIRVRLNVNFQNGTFNEYLLWLFKKFKNQTDKNYEQSKYVIVPGDVNEYSIDALDYIIKPDGSIIDLRFFTEPETFEPFGEIHYSIILLNKNTILRKTYLTELSRDLLKIKD